MFASVSASSRQGPRGLAREGSCARRSWRAAAASPQASSSSESDPGTKLALVSERERERYSREIPASRDAAPLIAGAPDDFFLLLRVSEDCDDDAEIKTSFRKLLKDAHPDKAGEAANDLAILMNLAYATLSDRDMRNAYKAALKGWRKAVGGSFDGQPVSAWSPDAPDEQTALFVDEASCIGCKMCAHIAPNTFFMDDEHGRARVFVQWGDNKATIEEAVETCPVEVIYYVKRPELALLEYVMKQCKMENTATMAAKRGGNFGPPIAGDDPFKKAAEFLNSRRTARPKDFSQQGGEGKSSNAKQRQAVWEQNDALASSIAKAWLALPVDARARAWPEWASNSADAAKVVTII